MKCLDSSIIIDILKGIDDATSKIEKLGDEEICSTIINLIEISIGVYLKKDINYEEQINKVQTLFDKLYLLNFNYDSAILSAKIAADLIKDGKQIDANDCSIAAIMLANGINTIITRDKEHFRRIKGIKVEIY